MKNNKKMPPGYTPDHSSHADRNDLACTQPASYLYGEVV